VDKLLLISIIIATVVIPAVGARLHDPRRGLFFTVAGMTVAVFGYFLAVFFVYPRLM
jgi:hypothetical protein